jgi:Flp pilus assembly protein TadG
MFATRRNKRSTRGTSIIEVLAGSIFLIPLALFFVDIASLTMVEQLNEHLAKDAARAAANQLDAAHAHLAAAKAVSMFPLSALVTDVTLECTYKDGSVSAVTTMEARVPAPFWGIGGRKMVAASLQPVVGVPADL